MPRTGAPPTIGDRPITGAAVARRASAIPGTARITPIETTGLLGGRSTTSASDSASRTPGAGVEVAAPTTSKLAAGTSACSRTHHSWKWTVRPSDSVTCVSIGVSVAGSSWTPGCHRSHSRRVTSESGTPAASH